MHTRDHINEGTKVFPNLNFKENGNSDTSVLSY